MERKLEREFSQKMRVIVRERGSDLGGLEGFRLL